MNVSGQALSLQLLEAEARGVRPAGMVITDAVVSWFANRMQRRVEHYAALRVTKFAGSLVLWSPDDKVDLPWIDDDQSGGDVDYITHIKKQFFFPVGYRPNIPEKWSDTIAEALGREVIVSQPVLILPNTGTQSEEGDYICVGLGGNSVPVSAVEWGALT